MTREKNKILRVEQATTWLSTGENWHDVLFTDETTVALQGFADMCYRKKGHEVTKSQPKHPLKLHVWGGISRCGPGPIHVFEGKLLLLCLHKSIVCIVTCIYISLILPRP